MQTGKAEGKLAPTDVVKAAIEIGHAVFKVVGPLMPAGKKRRRQLARLMGRNELEEVNRDVGLLAPMLQAVRHRRRKESLARRPLGAFKDGEVPRQVLDAVDVILKAAARNAVNLV